MKIYEAAAVVLREEGRPMSPNDIYTGIQARNLFEFSAKDAVAVVTKALRTRSNASSKQNINILFERSNDGFYTLTQ